MPLSSVVALAGVFSVHAEGHHWSYGKHGGPAEWGELDQAFASCQLGKVQSPIDIRGAKAADLPAIKFDYKPAPLKVIDNGHTIQVNYAPGQHDRRRRRRATSWCSSTSTSRARRRSTARRTRWSPTSCTRARDGKLAVVAVLLDKGGANPTLRRDLEATCRRRRRRKSPRRRTIDAATLLPADKGYYTFQGSLTTPPCSEGVRWFVLKTPMTIAASELTAFGKLYPMNARPTQPLNGRAVEATR